MLGASGETENWHSSRRGFSITWKEKRKRQKRKVKGIYFVFQENFAFHESANNLATRVCQFKPTRRTVGKEGTSMQHLSMISGVLGIDVTVDLREVNVTSWIIVISLGNSQDTCSNDHYALF